MSGIMLKSFAKKNLAGNSEKYGDGIFELRLSYYITATVIIKKIYC